MRMFSTWLQSKSTNKFFKFPTNPNHFISLSTTRKTRLFGVGCITGFSTFSAYQFSKRKTAPCIHSTEEEFPFDIEKILTTKEIIQLKISSCGVSEKPEFKGSIFKCTKGEADTWIVIRQKVTAPSSARIPLCQGTGEFDIDFVGTDFFQEAQKEKIFMCGIEQVPDTFSSGCIGHVYSITMPNGKRAVCKVYRGGMQATKNHIFLPLRLGGDIKPLSLDGMIHSFNKSMNIVKTSRLFQKSPHYPDCLGVIYIKEWNVWAVAYEHLEGSHPSNYNTDLEKGRKIFTSIAKGLKILDEQGAACTDLKSSNVLIRQDGMAMFFDDIYVDGQRSSLEESRNSKQQFGTLLYNALMPRADRMAEQATPRNYDWVEPAMSKMERALGIETAHLIHACWNHSITWDEIIQKLSTQ